MTDKMGIGIIGCGAISRAYFTGAAQAPNLSVVACADINSAAAEAKAVEYSCRAQSVQALLENPDVELVVNLTIPRAHVPVALDVLNAGKHVYCEKPLAVTGQEARRLMDLSRSTGLRVGCAPDTFLGAGQQSCRQAFDEGLIGSPVAGFASMACLGHESWHPNPAFYYDVGGGPLLDMGPYYLTALVNVLGPARRVAASTKISYSERVATAPDIAGLVIPVHCTTHLTGVIDFDNGTIITMVMSFDVVRHRLPGLEIYGTEGSMQLPDPNGFGGSATVFKKGDSDWRALEPAHAANARMFGVVDMASAIRSGRPHRASGDLAFHVLEIMEAFDRSSKTGNHIAIESRCERPHPLPPGLDAWQID